MKKMIMAVLPQSQANIVLEGLARSGFTATYMESRGGVMHQSKRMLFLAVDQAQEKKAIEIIKSNTTQQTNHNTSGSETNGFSSVDSNTGGTVIFSWEIDHLETF
jgi:uncharacterized protein YaaQ